MLTLFLNSTLFLSLTQIQLMSKKILVTGATGLLGSHVLVELLKTNQNIRALYRNPEKIKKTEKIIQYYFPQNYVEKNNNIEWFKADILDIYALEKAFENIAIVYHCAAMVSFRRRDFSKMVQINRFGTENMVNFALSNNVNHFCHVSSTAAVGKPEKIQEKIVQETNKWEENAGTSGYGITKHLAEKEVWRGIEEGLNAVIVNPCVLFGPGNWNESSLTIFRTVAKGLRFYTPGANAVVDARDVAEIMVALVNKNVKNERFLLIGENLRFYDLLGKIALRLGKKPPTMQTPRFFAAIVWRLAAIISLVTSKKSSLTKETVHSAYSHTSYSNGKIVQELNFKFKTVDEAIDNVVNFG